MFYELPRVSFIVVSVVVVVVLLLVLAVFVLVLIALAVVVASLVCECLSFGSSTCLLSGFVVTATLLSPAGHNAGIH